MEMTGRNGIGNAARTSLLSTFGFVSGLPTYLPTLVMEGDRDGGVD